MRWRNHDVIMAVGGEDESEKIFLRPENESARSFDEILHIGRLHEARSC